MTCSGFVTRCRTGWLQGSPSWATGSRVQRGGQKSCLQAWWHWQPCCLDTSWPHPHYLPDGWVLQKTWSSPENAAVLQSLLWARNVPAIPSPAKLWLNPHGWETETSSAGFICWWELPWDSPVLVWTHNTPLQRWLWGQRIPPGWGGPNAW